MKIFGKIFLAGIIALLAAILVIANAVFSWTRSPVAAEGDLDGFAETVSLRLDNEVVGNAALLLLEDGEIVFEHFVSRGKEVTSDTQYQLASLSKWITAWGVMAMVEQGLVDLDAPVSSYIKRWSLPESEYNNDGVTIRRLLSHTAGLSDGLGYGGFSSNDSIQTLEESLTLAADRSPGNKKGAVRVETEPGERFSYSGGGYTLLQLLIEEVSGQSFNDYMQQTVFDPLGMSQSTFIIEGSTTTLTDFYDTDGKPAPHYRYTALAAASLYASASDIAIFLQANYKGENGEPREQSILSSKTLKHMREPESSMFGHESVGLWGLGACNICEK